MKLETSWKKLDVNGTPAQGYFAKPAMAKGPLLGIVVIQEAFGVDDFIQDVTDRLATAGYAALAPDLFSYGGKPAPLEFDRVEDAKNFLDTIPQAAWFDPGLRGQELQKVAQPQKAQLTETLGMLLVPERPWAQYVATLRAGRAALAAAACAGQKVGCVGFCLGGALAMRLACADPEIAAAVPFYGFAPPAEQLSGLRAPILAMYAENDPRINAGVPALIQTMADAGQRFTHHTYPGTSHAFMNDTRGNFHLDAMRTAWARTLSFFARELGGAE
jgi:carboxymethylenebutenolidase